MSIRSTLKAFILAFIGSLAISLLEVMYFEDSFYQSASMPRVSYGPNQELKLAYATSHNKICPTNFEMKLYLYLSSDRIKSNPNFNPVPYLINTKYMQFPEYFVYADNVDDINKSKYKVNQSIEVCDYLINSSPMNRIMTLTLYTSSQPLHLLLGWILCFSIFKLTKFMYLNLPHFIPNWIFRIGYVTRGIFRKVVKIFKDYEDMGK